MKPSHALATDLDGTLLRPDHTVSEATRSELGHAKSRGIAIAYVTGRPARWMQPVVATTGHNGTAVCANGAVLVDLETETIRSVAGISSAAVRDATTRLRDLTDGRIRFALEFAEPGPISNSGLAFELEFAPRAIPGGRVHNFDEPWRGATVVKILARIPDFERNTGDHKSHEGTFHDAVAERLEQAEQSLRGLTTVTQTSRTDLLLELGPLGVDKATGLAELCQEFGLDSGSVVAAGDMPNDIPMIQWAGRGLAVTSAHPAVLAAADEVIPDPEHDGILSVLQTM